MIRIKKIKESKQYHFAIESLILYILNILDLFFTHICLSSGRAVEKNPIMVGIVDNLPLMILIKGILLGIALFTIVYLTYRFDVKIYWFLHALLIAAISVYGFVNIVHIINCIIIFGLGM